MTKKGHSALETELKQLKSVERPAIIKAIAEAREHGDLSEMQNIIPRVKNRALSKGASRILKVSCRWQR